MRGAIRLEDGSIVLMDGPRSRPRLCRAPGCRRHADRLCDGHAEQNNPETAKPFGCDLPICQEHATAIGEDTHLCPRCASAARAQFARLVERIERDGDPLPARLAPPVGDCWPRVHTDRPYLVIAPGPGVSSGLWLVRPGAPTVRHLTITGDLWWELEKLPGILDLS